MAEVERLDQAVVAVGKLALVDDEPGVELARDLDPLLADKFVGMYVNERTLNYGEDGREAIRKLLEMGFERGIIPMKANVDFVD